MSMRVRRLVPPILLAGALVVALPAMAGVKISSSITYYSVPGTTPKQLVSYMQRNPIRGDHGSAFANIRPNYSLSMTTKEVGGQCRANLVDVKIHFVTTLPKASNTAGMSRRTLAAWNGFVNFAQRHEETHRRSYVTCANNFISAAKRERAGACYAVTAEIRRMFSEAKRDCEAKQMAFDRGQRGALRSLALVRQAGY